MSRRIVMIGWITVVLILAGCGSSGKDNKSEDQTPTVTVTVITQTAEPGSAEYRTLTIDEFADIVANHSSEYTIVNVHIPYAGEIADTDAFIPYDDLDALTAGLPDKNAPIILYCRSGRMSEEASHALVDRGYTQVWDVPGGMVAWQNSGREIVEKQ